MTPREVKSRTRLFLGTLLASIKTSWSSSPLVATTVCDREHFMQVQIRQNARCIQQMEGCFPGLQDTIWLFCGPDYIYINTRLPCSSSGNQ